jgi:hypothetical protein
MSGSHAVYFVAQVPYQGTSLAKRPSCPHGKTMRKMRMIQRAASVIVKFLKRVHPSARCVEDRTVRIERVHHLITVFQVIREWCVRDSCDDVCLQTRPFSP